MIGPQWVGDAVMAAPLIASLADEGPVDILCPPALADLYRAMAGVRRIHQPAFARGRLEWRGRQRFARELRSLDYDLAVVCPNSWKSALIPWMAQIPSRRGLLGEARWGLLNDIRKSVGSSQPEAYASLAPSPGQPLPPPRLHASPLNQPHRLAWPESAGPRLALAPGAEFGSAKQWPSTNWATLARGWLQAGGSIMTLGGPKDRSIESEILHQLAGEDPSRILSRAGQTSLSEAISLLADSDAIVSNDSGLMHVAAALGRPTLGLYGSSDPRRTPVQGPRADHLWLGLSCSPCFKRECPLGTKACLVGIGPDQVLQRLLALRQNAGS